MILVNTYSIKYFKKPLLVSIILIDCLRYSDTRIVVIHYT